MTVFNETASTHTPVGKFIGLLLDGVSDEDLAIFARDVQAEQQRRLVAKHPPKDPKMRRHHYKCAAGHEFYEDAPETQTPWHSYARSKDVHPDKPEGGVCDVCRASIYHVRIEELPTARSDD